MSESPIATQDNNLINELKNLIASAKQQAQLQVNAHMTLLYWQLGHRLQDHLLNNQRADYAKQIVKQVAQQLTYEYGIHVAEYLTALPPKEVLQQKLHQAISQNQQRFLAVNAVDKDAGIAADAEGK
jgi:F0F1-type ATP synthase delta subunit